MARGVPKWTLFAALFATILVFVFAGDDLGSRIASSGRDCPQRIWDYSSLSIEGPHSFAEMELQCADFSGSALSETSFRDSDLTRATFASARLLRADFLLADMAGADFTGAELDEVRFAGAVLTDAVLAGLDLAGLHFTGANLAGADLAGADLSAAQLGRADLSEANLSGADLTGANLMAADLTDADLSGAQLAGARLQRANLTGVTGLTAAMFDEAVGTDAVVVDNTKGSHSTLEPVCRGEGVATAAEVAAPHRFVIIDAVNRSPRWMPWPARLVGQEPIAGPLPPGEIDIVACVRSETETIEVCQYDEVDVHRKIEHSEVTLREARTGSVIAVETFESPPPPPCRRMELFLVAPRSPVERVGSTKQPALEWIIAQLDSH